MKFSLSSIFRTKIENSLKGLITTRDKIEHIRRTYEKQSEKYIESAQAVLNNSKELKERLKELNVQTDTAKQSYENMIKNDKLEDAKLMYIFYKGISNSRDIVQKSYDSVEAECIKVKENLKNININKALIDTKLDVLKIQIETMNSVNMSSSALGDFGFDCNEMIDEVEREVKKTQFKYETKREVSDLVHNRSSVPAVASSIDTEFDEIVKTIKG